MVSLLVAGDGIQRGPGRDEETTCRLVSISTIVSEDPFLAPRGDRGRAKVRAGKVEEPAEVIVPEFGGKKGKPDARIHCRPGKGAYRRCG